MNAVRIVTKAELLKFLDETEWSATQLAKAAGLCTQAITRVTRGQRKRLGPDASEKVTPFLYGEKRPMKDDRRTSERRKADRRKGEAA
ncbi:hypothetical protein [Desulfocurvibacter africanus]|nr:hypothetical protein [Desulfocurvibacter africanus]